MTRRTVHNTALDDLIEDAAPLGYVVLDPMHLQALGQALEQAECLAATSHTTPQAQHAAQQHISFLLRQHAVERAYKS